MKATLALSTVAILGMTISAHARILCHGNYQVVGGQEISTPYCEDNNLAHVANSYGRRVSEVEVRNNPGFKNELCRWLGHDIRVHSACNSTPYDEGGSGK